MSKQKKNKSRATLVMALPLAVAGLTFGNQTAQALPLAAGITQQQDAVNHPISKAEKINPTTVEITYADGKRLTMDFYGENIFRLSVTTKAASFATHRPPLLQLFWPIQHVALQWE